MTHPFIQKWKPVSPQSILDQRFFTRMLSVRKPSEFNSREEDVEFVIRQIETYQCDITSNYKDWMALGFSLVHGFGESGRNYYHRISRFYPKYDYRECDRQYDRCLRGKRSGRTIRTFFYLAKMAGMKIPKRNGFTRA